MDEQEVLALSVPGPFSFADNSALFQYTSIFRGPWFAFSVERTQIRAVSTLNNLGSILLTATIALAGCGPYPPPRAAAPQGEHAAEAIAERAKMLDELYAEHFEKNLQLNPSTAQAMGDYRFNHLLEDNLSDAHLAASKALNDEYLAKAQNVPSEGLSNANQLSLEFFIDTLSRKGQAESVPLHLLPVNQFYSRPNEFAVQGSGAGVHPFKTEKDYRDFITKTAAFSQWIDTAIIRMREGMKRGIVLPSILVERTLPQLRAQFESSDIRKSTFYGPLKKLPASLTDEAKTALIADYKTAIRTQVMPAYKRLHSFMSKEYLAAGLSTHGLNALPGGDEWYAYLISHHTTTSMGADEIHEVGLAEVKRIREAMDKVRGEVGFEGDLQAFFAHLTSDAKFFFQDKEELIAAYQALKKRLDVILPHFFDLSPKTAYEVRPVEAFREKNAAGASYQAGTADGSRPGVFYINTFNLKAQPRWGTETLSLHEAAPGHHFQISLQQEMKDAPKFQRFSESTAFAEGWALYAESLGKEMGLFTDPYQYFGRLNDELLRAMRLVVDTGLHAKGWTREKAIDYMVTNSALAKTDIEAEVERYMAIPGQALSYKIGQLKITELRQFAQEGLPGFEDSHLREFHNQVLQSGSLPLSILESKIKKWVGSEQPRDH